MPQDLNQLSLDHAEMQRNYIEGIRNSGSAGYGGSGGIAQLNDTSNVNLPQGMPQYYGMLGSQGGKPGMQHELLNDEASAQGYLARVRQIDPNAKISFGQTNGGGGEGGGGGGTNEYYIDWDNSKLPQSSVPDNGHAAVAGGYGRQASDRFNPDDLQYDPNYGVMTDNRNFNTAKTDASWLDYSPYLIAAIATMGAAAPAMAAGMGAGEAIAGASLGTAGNAVMALPSVGRAISNEDYTGAALAALPAIGGMAGINPAYISGGTAAIRAGQAASHGDYTGAALAAAAPIASAAGVPSWAIQGGTAAARLGQSYANSRKPADPARSAIANSLRGNPPPNG